MESKSMVARINAEQEVVLFCGVSQGSIFLSLISYLQETYLTGEVIQLYEVSYHQYSNNTQLYILVPGFTK